MDSILGSALAFIIAISVLVAIHEYGHYLVARLAGIKVLRYSIGFGKPLWTRRAGKDRTEYCISALPLGGYVKLLDERSGDVDPREAHRAFNRAPIPHRIAVLVAGPMFNFLFAIAAYWAIFVVGVATVSPQIGAVEPDSYAARAGLGAGDEILAVGGREVDNWEKTLLALLAEMVDDGRVPLTVAGEDGEAREIVIDVGGEAARLTEPGVLFDGLGIAPWSPPAVIGELVEDGAAAGAGLQPGDRIVAIDGEPVDGWRDLVALVGPRPDERVTVTVERGGRELERELTLGAVTENGRTRGLLGVTPQAVSAEERGVRVERFGPLAAVWPAIERTWDTSVFTVEMLARMVTGQVSVKNISGPVNIAQFAGSSASAGFEYFLGFLAIVSISLGVLNLLPIPILDGGQIVYQLAEWVKGAPLSERAQMIGQQIGILLLVVIMGFAFYNDISRLLS